MSAAAVVPPDGHRSDDMRLMDAALALGRRNLGRTAPNPSVGALLVNHGAIVGRGCTAPGAAPMPR